MGWLSWFRKKRRRSGKMERARDAVHLLSARPPVVYVVDWALRHWDGKHREFFDALGRIPCLLLVTPCWSKEHPEEARGMRDLVRDYRRRHRRHEVVVLGNTEAECAALEKLGLDVLWFHQNATLREEEFRPLPGNLPEFDAIYNAVWSPYKRHELAVGVRRLALLCSPPTNPGMEPYGEEVRRALEGAVWLRSPFVEGQTRWGAEEVNAALNRARVGLCLSALEGAMYASGEYLLAGLPVVTTHNRGGRDVLFDPEYTRWVGDDPREVARGVEELVREGPPPATVRARVLEKMGEHRRRLLGFLEGRVAGPGAGGCWPREWPNKLMYRMPFGSILGELEKA